MNSGLSSKTQWDGSSGGRLLVDATCHYGDIIKWSRFFPKLENRGNWVLWCQPVLVDLFERFFHGRVVSSDVAPPPHDFWVPLMWLHSYLGSHEENPPLKITATPEKIQKYAFLRDRNPIIGLCWQAQEADSYHSWRKLLPEEVARIVSSIPYVHWVNLQYGRTHPSLSQVDFKTWEDTAGLVHNLDGVVSCDTSVPHFSGSMGKNTIVLHGKAQTSVTQYQDFHLYNGAVKAFVHDYGNPCFSKTSTDKFLEYAKQNPEFWKF
jgi:hypothetical protein